MSVADWRSQAHVKMKYQHQNPCVFLFLIHDRWGTRHSLKDLTVDRNIDVFALIETWLSKETEEFTIRDLHPTGYECYNVSIRVARFGGGICVIDKTVVRLREKHPCIVTNFKSFEFTTVLLKHIPRHTCASLLFIGHRQWETVLHQLRNSLKNFQVSWSS